MADMDLTTYSGLKAAVALFLNRADLTEQVPGFIALAEAQMNRALRTQRMIQASAPTITAGSEVVALPANFLEAIILRLSDGTSFYDLTPTTLEQIAASQADSTVPTTPTHYAIGGTASGREIRLYPAPDIAYTASLTYFGKPTALSGSNATNWILAEAPDAYLYGALLQAAPYLRDDDRLNVWTTLYGAALEGLKTMDRTIVGPLRTELAHIIPSRHGFDIFRGG